MLHSLEAKCANTHNSIGLDAQIREWKHRCQQRLPALAKASFTKDSFRRFAVRLVRGRDTVVLNAMRIFQRLASLIFIVLGFLLCVPPVSIGWEIIRAGMSSGTVHATLQVAGASFTGWQLWVLVGGSAVAGLGLVGLGISWLTVPLSDR